jgi:hypothetical protein
MVDMHPMSRRVEGNLIVSVISPLADDYEYFNDQKCVMEMGYLKYLHPEPQTLAASAKSMPVKRPWCDS